MFMNFSINKIYLNLKAINTVNINSCTRNYLNKCTFIVEVIDSLSRYHI